MAISIDSGMHFYTVISENSCPELKKLRVRKTMAQRMSIDSEMQICLIVRGNRWFVTLRHNKDDGRLWVEDGWTVFAGAMRLRYLDIVSFKYIGDGTFETHIFDVSSLRSPKNDRDFDSDGENLEACAAETKFFEGAGTNAEIWVRKPTFEVELQQCHKGKEAMLIIPNAFCASTDLNFFTSVWLIRDDYEKGWEVEIEKHKLDDGDNEVLAFTTGWRSFLAFNKIKVGDFLIFEVDEKEMNAEKTLNLRFDVVRRDSVPDGLRLDRVFMKLILPGDESQIMLPHAIAKELDMVKKREVQVLSRIGVWPMKLHRNALDGGLYLGAGWSDFYSAHGLSHWQLIQFKNVGDMSLQASIMNPNGEEEMAFKFDSKGKGKEKVLTVVKEEDEISFKFFSKGKENISTVVTRTATPNTTGGERSCQTSRYGEQSLNPSRDATVIPYLSAIPAPTQVPVPRIFQIATVTSTFSVSMSYLHALEIRREFVRKTGLQLASQIRLVCVDGTEWDITIHTRVHKDGQPIVRFTTGWREFFMHHRLGARVRCMLYGHVAAPHFPPPTSLGIRIHV